MFGKRISEYLGFQAVVLVLIAVVGLLRLGVSLAGVPTIVFGYFALTFVTPIIRSIFPETSVFNALSASIVLGIMLIPMVSSQYRRRSYWASPRSPIHL